MSNVLELKRLNRAELGKKIPLRDGTGRVVEFKKKKAERKKVAPGEVAIHEMHHVMVRPDLVLYVTIIPQGNSAGHTMFTKMDLRAAMGPKAMGDGGTKGDEAIVAAHGAHEEGLMSDAAGMLLGKEEIVHEIAAVLEAAKTLSGEEIQEMIKDLNEGYEIEVIIHHPDGKEEKHDQGRSKARGGMFEIAEDVISPYDLPREELQEAA